MRKYLQYLLFRGVYYRRMIDYIGPIERSRHYLYIREACCQDYERMCFSMPAILKENGFDAIFRNLVIGRLYYAKIYDIFKRRSDPVMSKRADETMKGSVVYLFTKVVLIWLTKAFNAAKTKIFSILRAVRRHNNGASAEHIRETIAGLDVRCIMMENKFERDFSPLNPEVYQSLSEYGMKPLFILFGKHFSVRKEGSGYILEIPFQFMVIPVYSKKDRMLLKEALRWIGNMNISWVVRRRIAGELKNNFLQYTYIRKIAAQILGAGKIKCVLTFAENSINLRVFLYQAKRLSLPTVLYYTIAGMQPLLLYRKYYSDIVMVCNKIQLNNFINAGYPADRCHVVGSFNFAPSSKYAGMPVVKATGGYKILYFTKGIKPADEAVLDELIEGLKSIMADYSLVIKKHPKDLNIFSRFKGEKVFITNKSDYAGFVKESSLIVSQYSEVIPEIIPLGKPVIVYTYGNVVEYGERAYFKDAELPNYLRYVQNKEEFHRAIGALLNLTEPEPLPQKLIEDLYGYMDTSCGKRIADIIGSAANIKQEYPV